MRVYADRDLNRLSDLIADRTGLDTFEHHRERLIEVLHQEAVDDLAAYITYLGQFADGHPVWQSLLSDLTIGETYFRRDMAQMAALRNHILPEIIQRKRKQQDFRLNIWSVGCSSGEELYTLAILLAELLPVRDAWAIDIMGTDINATCIDMARSALYKAWSFRNTEDSFKAQYFLPIDGQYYRVRPDIQEMVRFQQNNLMQSQREEQDLILCRNVLMYFTSKQRQFAEERLVQALQSKGWLLLSSVETLYHQRPYVDLHHIGDTIAYQKQQNPIWQVAKPQSRPESDEDSYYQQAVAAFHQDEWEKAGTLVNEHKNEKVHWQILMAALSLAVGNIQTAKEQLQKLTQRFPFATDAHYLMALVYHEYDDTLAARTALRATLYCDPNFALAHALNGDLFFKAGAYQRAQRAWQRALASAQQYGSDVYLSDVVNLKAGQLIAILNDRLS